MRQFIDKNGSSEKQLSLQNKYSFEIKICKNFYRDFQRKFANIIIALLRFGEPFKNMFPDLICLSCFVKRLSWDDQVNKDIKIKI